MLPHTRFTADRGDSPVSYNSSAESNDPQQGVTTQVNHGSQADPAPRREDELWREEEAQEDDEVSDLDNSTASETEAASVSFGALARAQASIARVDGTTGERSDAGATPTATFSKTTNLNDSSAEPLRRKHGQRELRQHSRPSKHAPTEITSKKAVSRKRSVVPIPKRDVRDPRFENALGPINEQKIKSNYAFLEEYREHEMKALRAELKKAKSDLEKEQLKREILRMESRKGAQLRKDAEQEVLRRHRKEEKAKIELGKAPYYLKRSQVKKEALIERYGHMKAKEVDKLIERRRKKRSSRDKRETPQERRIGAIQ